MRSIATLTLKWSIGVSLTPALVGCGADDRNETEIVSSVTYPYVMADGPIACSDGSAVGRNIEYYFFDIINRELQASPELRDFAAKEGIEIVDSCESARRLSTLNQQHIVSKFEAKKNRTGPQACLWRTWIRLKKALF